MENVQKNLEGKKVDKPHDKGYKRIFWILLRSM